MAGFLYFAKGWRQPVTRKLAEQWGLGYAFDGEPTDADLNHPELGAGRVFADLMRQDARPLLVRGRPSQEWCLHSESAEAANRPEIHVGVWADGRPTPVNLSRQSLLPGHDVTLGDGQAWVAPVAKEWDEEAASHTVVLPRGAVYDAAAGSWRPGEIDPRYQPLWEVAVRFDAHAREENRRWRESQGEEGLEANAELDVMLSVPQSLDDATVALQANYLVGPVEASVLGWFSRDHQVAAEVLQAVVDWPSLLAMAKKKATGTAGT